MREIRRQIARGQEELGAIEHSKKSARTRAQEYRQTAAELQKEVEQLQEERQAQHKSLLLLTEARHKAQKEVKGLNYTLQEEKAEFEAIKGNMNQITKDLHELQGYLTEAQQNRAWELSERWNGDFTR